MYLFASSCGSSGCRHADETNTTATGHVCSCYVVLCSQIIDGASYNSSIDWFSFGVVLYEMIVGRLPFDGFDEQEMFQRICLEEPKYPKIIQPDAANCIRLV